MRNGVIAKMSITYVHLSDIHFGQEKGADLIIHNDVKERLIEDAQEQVRIHAGGFITGRVLDLSKESAVLEWQAQFAARDRASQSSGAFACGATGDAVSCAAPLAAPRQCLRRLNGDNRS
jgi:hypothetical protein